MIGSLTFIVVLRNGFVLRFRDGHHGDLIRHYFDQSHFVKAFKRYSGVTPTAYFRVNDYGRLYIPEKQLIRPA